MENSFEQRIAILVAEDSEDSQFLLRAYCRGTAFDLTFVEDGERAIEAYLAGGFQIVVMDVQMPVMDGLAATRLIRGLELDRGSRRIPILALTANANPHDAFMAHKAGCDVHLTKPISKSDFLNALGQWKSDREESEAQARPSDTWAQSTFEELRCLACSLTGMNSSYGFPDIS